MRQIKVKGKAVSKPAVDPSRKTAWYVHYGHMTIGSFKSREAAEKFLKDNPGGKLWLDYEKLDPIKRYMVVDDCRVSYKSMLVATAELPPGTRVLDRQTGETFEVKPVTNVRTYATRYDRTQRRELPIHQGSGLPYLPTDLNECIAGHRYYVGSGRRFTLDDVEHNLTSGQTFVMPERK